MTQEQKELLLKDLCARLPYGVKVDINFYDTTKELSCDLIRDLFLGEKCLRPYLRPMSSMTEEEQFQLGKLLGATSFNLLKGEYSSLKELLEYSYKNHIDLFGLIPMGLALEAPRDMYKIV